MARKAFEHESIQDGQSIAEYLRALTKGIAKGTLKLSDEETDLVLHPSGLINLEIRASRKKGRERIDLRLTWKPSETGDQGPLRIESKAVSSDDE